MEYVRLLFDYIKSKAITALLLIAVCATLILTGWLGGLERADILYCLLLWAAFCLTALAAGFFRFLRRHRQLKEAADSLLISPDALPQPGSRLEEDWRELVRLALDDRAELRSGTDRRYRELKDYFTLWAHQVKNPISAMGLLLQQEETDRGELEQQLFEMEQYVDMVLNYLRLGEDSSDLVLRRCDLDDIIRASIKKYAKQFIRRRISLEYEETGLTVLTDEKWLGFVLDQLLSNALKYTPSGKISISAGENCLVIEDTGVGIAPEDLPRIFERGYTGYNGRADRRSTGIGLWLCKKVLGQLGHGITAASQVGKGTRMTISFGEDREILE